MAQRFEFNEEHDELEDMPLDYQKDDSDEDTDEKRKLLKNSVVVKRK
ncbi:hypothetical protein SD457_18160 [Coprobacillaceae bacterium CR2/5/TPMF4]|nr:hypothetical protein SD457_18160 [Coprobacillaceae bacterium CR2/5/TPMF4]